MKFFIVMLAAMVLTACSQENNEQTTSVVAKVKPIEKAQVVNTTAAQTHVDEVVGQEEEVAADTNALPTPVQDETLAQEIVKPKSVVKVEETKPASVRVAKKVPAVAPQPTLKDKKVIAPLVQGKQPIKQQPNPAPSEIMLKPDSGMSLEKANSLTKKCKSCHASEKDKVGPAFKKIQAAYGSADVLAAIFESGFAVESRKVAAADAKWKKKAKTMTGQYKNLIQKQVKKGAFTYKELADAVFAK